MEHSRLKEEHVKKSAKRLLKTRMQTAHCGLFRGVLQEQFQWSAEGGSTFADVKG